MNSILELCKRNPCNYSIVPIFLYLNRYIDRMMGSSDNEILFGSLIFLIISLMRGITYVSVSYISNNFSNIVTLAISFIPLIALLFPRRTLKSSYLTYLLPPSLWFVGLLISNVIYKLFLIELTLMVVFFVIKKYMSSEEFTDHNLSGSIIWCVIFDQLFRLANQGLDPVILLNSLKGIVLVSLAFVLWLLLIWNTVRSGDTINTNSGGENRLGAIPYFSVFGTITLLVVYMQYFANSGILSINLGLNSMETTLVTPSVAIIAAVLVYWGYTKFSKFNIISVIAAFFLIIAVYIFPGTGSQVVFWGLGYLSMFWLIMTGIQNMSARTSFTQLGISLSLAIFYIVATLSIAFTLLNETVLNGLILTGLACLLILIQNYVHGEELK